MFKIISCGWNCAEFIEQTLRSIEYQTNQDFQVCIGYEGDDGGDQIIERWCDSRGAKWTYDINLGPYKYDVRTRWEAIANSNPEDDDIILFLDLDGDELAHPQVLEHLLSYYEGDVLATYGSYEPKPASGTCAPAIPYPTEVIAAGSYRAFGLIYFNHLRTMKGRIFKAIPIEQFQYSDGRGWYTKGCDVQFMLCSLELAGPRHRVISETLMYYNSENPNSAWRVDSDGINTNNEDFMRRSPLLLL